MRKTTALQHIQIHGGGPCGQGHLIEKEKNTDPGLQVATESKVRGMQSLGPDSNPSARSSVR